MTLCTGLLDYRDGLANNFTFVTTRSSFEFDFPDA